MPNPFTSESRDAVLSVNIDGFMTRLRAPESLRRLLKVAKPAHVGLGDFALKSMYDAFLISLIVAGRYREVQTTLEVHFGPIDHASDDGTTSVVPHYAGSR